MRFSNFAALSCLVSAGVSTPTPSQRSAHHGGSRTNSARAADTTICGDVMAEANSGTSIFYASDIYACLESVPFNQAPALRFLSYYNTTIQFQSTLAFLKNPPEGYQQPAVDVEDILTRITANVTKGIYQNQYEFEADVQRLTFAMHDSHVDLRSGILSPFSFGSPYYVSSVSIDGKQLPKLYLTEDIIAAQSNGWSWTPSPISEINGEDAVSFVTRFASQNSLGRLEDHAEWNDMMGGPTGDILGSTNIFGGDATFYPGDELNFTFENNTDLETFWISYYNYMSNTGPISTGGDMYNFFVLGLAPVTNDSYVDSVTDNRKRQEDDGSGDGVDLTSWNSESSGAYPKPADLYQEELLINGGGVVTGYYLEDASTGVLSIPTFEQFGDNLDQFSETVQAFIDGAKSRDLAHIVIDLQQNQGGSLVLAYDTYARFFPQTQPFAGSRRRSHELGNILGNVTTAWWNNLDPNNDEEAYNWELGLGDEWVISPRLNAETNDNFLDWEDYANGPSTLGDRFSLVEAYNLSNVDFDYEALGMSPYGWGDNLANTTQAYTTNNIVIVTDGLCSSTCSLFVEFMTSMGVKTIAMGGRPVTGPMQAVSGTRGARNFWASDLDDQLAFAAQLSPDAKAALPEIPDGEDTRTSGIWTRYAGFNLRDQIRSTDAGNADAVPLQFLYQAADCRLFYTMQNLYNMSRLWRDVAEAAWVDDSICVEDSMGYTTSADNDVIKKPPVASTTAHYIPFDGVDSGSDNNGDDDDGDDDYINFDILTDSYPQKTSDTIIPCTESANGQYTCPTSDLYCVEVQVKCRATKTKTKTKTNKGTSSTTKAARAAGASSATTAPKYKPVHACLPLCDDNTDCTSYNTDNLGLYCHNFTPREKTMAAKLSGVDSGRKPIKTLAQSKWTGLCYPVWGTKALGSCPA
ncbi:hypothetical protein BX600DRAFT_444595 [Xylariales sp. PMI_506]|nr:hypothetical protein BX600DRAFT_444595 [Xylariales sp. PMI_506]